MEETKQRYFSLKTKAGCWRLLALCIVIILVSSLFGRLFQSDFGTIKIEQVTIDARGAELNGELYYPTGISSQDKLPAVVVTHGGGCTYGVTKGIASEIARRGFVVLNVSAYGSGISTMPPFEESGQGEDLNVFLTPLGLLDAANFVRSLTFVDATRVGLIGHSMGAGRIYSAALLDCGYLTFNDTMINVLYDTFGQPFTEEEINQDADALAEARLNTDQLQYYYFLRDTNRAMYDNKIKSIISLGATVGTHFDTATVSVAGYDVQRLLQTNECLMGGEYDWIWNIKTDESVKARLFSEADLTLNAWYDLDLASASSRVLGNLYETSIVSDEALAGAIDNRTTVVIYQSAHETHSKEFFSNDISSAIVKYFEQTLNYNRGDLTAASTVPLDAANNIWIWRAICNFIAMIAMFAMMVALCGLLVKTPVFAFCVNEVSEDKKPPFNKKLYWIFGSIAVAFTFLSIYIANNYGLFVINPSQFMPLTRGASLTIVLLGCLAIGSIIMAISLVAINKKKNGITGLGVLNIGMKFKNIMKTLLISLILLGAAYGSLIMIEYLFGQDYRLWMSIFTEMKADYWFIFLRYIFIVFPLFLLIGMAVNYTVRKDIPEWKDTLVTVVINSVGIWICCLINYLIADLGNYQGVFFCSFMCSYQVCLIVPITVYITRKMYNMTKSIWLGALLNTFVICWSLTSAIGVNDIYTAQTWISNFLNF